MDDPASLDIVVVGPCAAGKTTLVRGLRHHGHHARVCAQEHSGVPNLWRHQGTPLLIGLRVSLDATRLRRDARWSRTVYAAQLDRLAVAYAHADLVIDTDGRSTGEVLAQALDHVASRCRADVSWGGSSSSGES